MSESFEDLFKGYDGKNIVEIIYKVALNRMPSSEEINSVVAELDAGRTNYRKLFMQLILSAEFVDNIAIEAVEYHLLFIHNTRMKLIKHMLPKADVILDIGGANGSLIEYGYNHDFNKLILTDLPPESRIEELRKIDLAEKWSMRKNIEVLYTPMTDLSMIEGDSVDLVWVGQVVEHVTENELKKSFSEISRILTFDGVFCFDTPNDILARIHSPQNLLHPEHKKEYTPAEMRTLLQPYFRIEQELGLVPMPISYKTKRFSYNEMILNNSFSDNLDQSYIMYFMCSKNK